jgi:hypothetical protein
MKGFLVGCGVVALLVVGVIAVGGFYLYNRFAPQITQGLQSAQKLEREIQKIVPGANGLNFNLSTVNGKTTARVSVAVPFDPTAAGEQPARVAQQILRSVRENLPANLVPAQRLEIRLFRSAGGTSKERVFSFDLTKPLPAPTPPKS